MLKRLWQIVRWRARHAGPILHAMLSPKGDRALWNAWRYWVESRSPLPTVPMCELFAERFQAGTDECIAMHPPTGGGAVFTNCVETFALGALVKAIMPSAVLEIGTYRGRSTWHLLHNAPPNATIYTIDLPDSEQSPDAAVASTGRDCLPKCERVKQLLIDTHKWDGQLPEKVQFVFIDGDHTYAGVKNDTEKAWRCIDDVACVCWHDSWWPYDDYGIARYLGELRCAGYDVFRIQEESEACSLALWMTAECAAKAGLRLPSGPSAPPP